MDKDKKWDRKEVVTVDPGSLLSGGVDVYLYGKGKDYGKHAHGWGRTEEEARENAYKHWRENYEWVGAVEDSGASQVHKSSKSHWNKKGWNKREYKV